MSEDTTPGQLEEIRAELRAGARRMGDIEQRLAENTAITMQVKDLLDMQNAARVGYKAAVGAGKFIQWGLAICAAAAGLWAFFHGGPRP